MRTAVLLAAIVFVADAGAQTGIDPSAALLLNGSTATTNTRSESNRYTVRPRSGSLDASRASSSRKSQEPSTPVTPATIQTNHSSQTTTVVVPGDQGVVVVPMATPTAVRAPEATEAVNPEAIKEVPSEMTADVAVPVERMLDLSISSVFFFENADSSHGYRRHNMNGPGYHFGARAWLSPEFALGGSYFSSVAGYIPDGSGNVTATRSAFSFGLFFRKPFHKAALTFGIESLESQLKVSADATARVTTKTNGVRLSLEGEYETLDLNRWILGFSIAPKSQHEESNTATSYRSGDNAETYIVGASVERRWKMNESNALFFRLQHTLERNLFSGRATNVDSQSGVTPTGVSITTGTTLIQFGYNWGH